MMDEASKQYTAFTVGNIGFFECKCMPFGLYNAPATFQRLMQNCLGELNLTYCLIYLDDIIIFSKTEEEHLHHLQIVFECFREHNLKLKPTKCEINYFAHHISKEGVWPSNENLQLWLGSLHHIPTPRYKPFWAWWDITNGLLMGLHILHNLCMSICLEQAPARRRSM